MTLLSYLFALVLAGCTAGSPYPAVDGVSSTFSSLQQNILNSKCVSCHSDQNASGGVSFSDYVSTISSTGVVVPYQPFQSQLYVQCEQGLMPQGGTPLNAAQLQALYQWIALGALNN